MTFAVEEIAQDIERIERKAILQIAAKLAKARDVFRHRRAEGGFQITAVAKFNQVLAANNLDLGEVHVRVPKNSG